MASPYTNVSVPAAYNANPPSNDGSKTSDNLADWSNHVIAKVGAPLKAAIESLDTNVSAAFGKVFGGAGVSAQSSSYIVQSADQSKIIYYTGTGGHTHTTPDATIVGTPFAFFFVNVGTAITTLDGSGSQTINGAADITFRPGQGALVFTDGANWFSSQDTPDNPTLLNEQSFDGAVSDGEVVRWDVAGGDWNQAQANNANNAAVGIADVTNSKVYLSGQLSDNLVSGLTPGAKQYLSDSTPGALTETAPSQGSEKIRIGWATTATGLVVDVDPEAFEVGQEILLSEQSVTDVASVVFTSVMTSTYDEYIVRGRNVIPEDDDEFAQIRVSNDDGVSYESGASAYGYASDGRQAGETFGVADNTATSIRITGDTANHGVGAAAGEPGLDFEVRFSDPDAAKKHMFRLESTFVGGNGSLYNLAGSGIYWTAEAIDALEFSFGTNNVASGTFRMFGISK